MDTTKIQEAVDPEKARYLVHIGVGSLKALLVELKPEKDEDDMGLTAAGIVNSCRKFVQGKGVSSVQMRFAKDREDGRMFGGHLQACTGQVRSLLCKGVASDIDMVNCHPTLAVAIISDKLQDIQQLFEPIRHYVYNREETLAKMMEDCDMTRNKAKDAILWAMNKSDYLTLPVPYSEKARPFFQDAAHSHDRKESGRLIQLAATWIEEYDPCFQVTAMVFDGCHVSKRTEIPNVFRSLGPHETKGLCEYLHTKCVEYKVDMKWACKDFETDIELDTQLLEEMRLTANFEDHITTCVRRVGYDFVVTCKNGNEKWMNKQQLKQFFEHFCYDKVLHDAKGNISKKKVYYMDEVLTPEKNHLIKHYEDQSPYPPPLVAPEGVYNTWVPFDCEKFRCMSQDSCNTNGSPYTYNKVYIRAFLDVLSGLVGDRKAGAQFILHWIYRLLHHPS
eukprot:6175478-Pleurochrysis_carterae.AAC.2